jgi:hypothetical protein
MNGVCVKWIGWVDLETLTGKARLIFDDYNAKASYRYSQVMQWLFEGTLMQRVWLQF